MMKTIITLFIGLALVGALSAENEKGMTGGACCAKGSSRAAMMTGAVVAEMPSCDDESCEVDEKKTVSKKKDFGKKAQAQKNLPIEPAKIDLREIKKRLDMRAGK